MRTSKSFFFFCFCQLVSMAHNAYAGEDLRALCEKRIEILEKDMRKILKSYRYSYKFQAEVKSTIKNKGFKLAEYKQKLAALKELLMQDPDKGLPSLNCLFHTNDIIIDLDIIANAGNKNLNDFSSRWRRYFPGQAQYLGYE